MKCSLLNALLADYFIIQDASCSCGHLRENELHFVFECNLYTGHRAKLHQTIIRHAPFNLQTLLYGEVNVNYDIKREIFETVHLYIECTSRFDT